MKEKLRSLKTWQKFVLVFVGIWVFFGVVKALDGGKSNESVAQEEIGKSANEQYSNRKTAESESDKQVEQESIEAQSESDEWAVNDDDLATLDEAMVALINTTDGALTKWEYDDDNRVVYLWTNDAVKANTHDERVWFAEEYGNRALSNATGILFPEKANDRTAVSVYFVYQNGDIWATSEILGNGFNVKD